jgi:heme/copper-type cytochrome/quinol oxidase subunit 2
MSTTTGAILALIVVASLGVAVRTPLTRIPENTLKYAVGIMLVTFGTFWAGEGLGINWPLSDLFLIALIFFYLVLSGATILWLKKHRKAQAAPEARTEEGWKKHLVLRILWGVFDFFCGDWTVFWGVAITIALTILIKQLSFLAVALPAIGIIYMAGIAISFLTALNPGFHQFGV